MRILDQHEKIVLQFSGGKDSIACLLMVESWWDKITVLWTNTGDAFPDTIEQMAKVREMVPHFHELRTNQPEYIRENGWPSDLIPVHATKFGQAISADKTPLIQGYPLCCGANIWNPMFEETLRLGATLVLRGTRKSDARRATKAPTEIHHGVTFFHPIWDWPAHAVFDFLEDRGFLPSHYRETETSLDCMHCTAYLHENARKMQFLHRKYPDVSMEVQGRLKEMVKIVFADLAHLERAVI